MTPQLGNCRRCKKLFIRSRDICPECYEKQEQDFLKVTAYIRENQGATIQEVSDETGVTVSQIRQFIWSGRILISDLPNLSYPCEGCGALIRKEKMCKSCLQNLYQLAEQVDGKEKEERNENDRKSSVSYISHKY